MKTIKILLIVFALSNVIAGCKSQLHNSKTVVFKVSGVCNKCKSTIEAASNQSGISIAVWDVDEQRLSLTYDTTKTNSDIVLKQIAYAGYDNERFLAPDEAYANLDECCHYVREFTNQVTEPTKVDQNIQNTEVASQDTLIEVDGSVIFSRFYEAYFSLKDALINGNPTLVAGAAKELHASAAELEGKQNVPIVKLVWIPYSSKILEISSFIQTTKQIESQRMKFKELTSSVANILEKATPNYPVYLDHCPMFDNGKGADWLSKEKEIRNPYYGNMMMNCGSNKAVIN